MKPGVQEQIALISSIDLGHLTSQNCSNFLPQLAGNFAVEKIKFSNIPSHHYLTSITKKNNASVFYKNDGYLDSNINSKKLFHTAITIKQNSSLLIALKSIETAPFKNNNRCRVFNPNSNQIKLSN
ncbi:MAG: hypothetical protein EOO96_09245 [Pedobacter sp.]|nr:MAG: hypothetical protein EOO96_09245 [Pedobacter sp.]